MAGAGYKLFNTGDVLLASEVNTYLMQQTVMVFANATARTSALSGVLAEGMLSYLADTNATEVYDGSAWVSVSGTGDITGVTAGTGISGGGTTGTVTITNDMATTITAAGDIVVGTGSGTYDNLPIGTTGQVLTADTTVSPYKVKWAAPAAAGFVGCSLYKSGAQSVATLTNAVITFDSENFDTDAFHSTSTNTSRITIPSGKDGKYLISSTLIWASNSTAQRAMKLLKNGTTYYEWCEDDANSSGITGFSGSIVLSLVATDYIEMVGSQNSGGNVNVNGGVTNTRFDIVYLGA